MRYRKRPVEVDALELSKSDLNSALVFVGDSALNVEQDFDTGLNINTPEGIMHASWGDMLIRDEAAGGVYPCDPEVFDATYDPVED